MRGRRGPAGRPRSPTARRRPQSVRWLEAPVRASTATRASTAATAAVTGERRRRAAAPLRARRRGTQTQTHENDRPASVGPETAASHRDERCPGEQQRGQPAEPLLEKRDGGEHGNEQHRREQVREAEEARVLTRARAARGQRSPDRRGRPRGSRDDRGEAERDPETGAHDVSQRGSTARDGERRALRAPPTWTRRRRAEHEVRGQSGREGEQGAARQDECERENEHADQERGDRPDARPFSSMRASSATSDSSASGAASWTTCASGCPRAVARRRRPRRARDPGRLATSGGRRIPHRSTAIG